MKAIGVLAALILLAFHTAAQSVIAYSEIGVSNSEIPFAKKFDHSACIDTYEVDKPLYIRWTLEKSPAQYAKELGLTGSNWKQAIVFSDSLDNYSFYYLTSKNLGDTSTTNLSYGGKLYTPNGSRKSPITVFMEDHKKIKSEPHQWRIDVVLMSNRKTPHLILASKKIVVTFPEKTITKFKKQRLTTSRERRNITGITLGCILAPPCGLLGGIIYGAEGLIGGLLIGGVGGYSAAFVGSDPAYDYLKSHRNEHIAQNRKHSRDNYIQSISSMSIRLINGASIQYRSETKVPIELHLNNGETEMLIPDSSDWSMMDVQVWGGDFENGVLRTNAPVNEIREQRYIVRMTIAPKNRTDLLQSFEFPLTFDGEFLVEFYGNEGSTGTQGTAAINGKRGTDGGVGEKGSRGPDVEVHVRLKADTILKKDMLIAHIKCREHNYYDDILFEPGNSTLKIISYGGYGGNGGKGGTGGDASPCDGRINAGDGGNGGNGGEGGDGGRIIATIDSSALPYKHLIILQCFGGFGGLGGNGGDGGALNAGTGCSDPIPGKPGNVGEMGKPGYSGPVPELELIGQTEE